MFVTIPQEGFNVGYPIHQIELPHDYMFRGGRLLPELTDLQIAQQRLERLLETRPEADPEIHALQAQIAAMRGETPEEGG